MALERELRMLGHDERVLMIGAHPDDEDTELLALLVRGMGAEAAYLSLNRGEGGQNLIGPELGQALGLVRTEELLAARRLDGARQFFTRAYDFGFSKTQDETWGHWPRDSVLKDVVRIIRRYRPQVVVSVFSGTPRDGHGQHQAAGWAAREAFRSAGDSTRFPELAREEGLAPWTPLKLYRSTRFDTAATTVSLEGGAVEPTSGLSYHQIAMAGRSLHRSQDMGQLQRLGPSRVRLALLEDRTSHGGEALFAGVDTVLRGATGPVPPVSEATPDALLALRRAWARAGVAAAQLTHLDRAITVAAGVACDARSDDDRVIAGERVVVTLECANGGSERRVVEASLRLGPGLSVEGPASGALELAPGALVSRRVTVAVAANAPLTGPYFRLPAPEPAMYDWSGAPPAVRGDPFGSPPLSAEFVLDGTAVTSREVSVRLNDQAFGERRRPVDIVPRVDVAIEPDVQLWPVADRAPRRVTVTLTNGARDTTAGVLALELPPGWPAVRPQPFRLVREDERERYVFEVRPPAAPASGAVEVRAVARDAAGRRYDVGLVTVDYPHIRPRSLLRPALAAIHVAPLALPRLARVGYVRGAADRVPEALRGAGLSVTLLDARALEQGALSRYDAIIVGPRAYETDSALVAANDRLLAYARGGGLVLVQYQQRGYFDGGFAPAPLTLGGQPLRLDGPPPAQAPSAPPRPAAPGTPDRVTDETAPMRLLDPAGPIARTPNRLGDADWTGWVQERGLYFARSWAPPFRPALETHDPGEAPLEGGLLVAPVGRGTYVYTGLSFFRQLPAGVPGAFRLFANLLALAHR